MTKYIVNNAEVEYLHIEKKRDGTVIVHFEEKFNLVNAHMSVIMEKLKNNGLNGIYVFKKIQKYNIIDIWLGTIENLHGVLHALDIPNGCYTVNYQDAILTIDVPVYENMVGVVELPETKIEDGVVVE